MCSIVFGNHFPGLGLLSSPTLSKYHHHQQKDQPTSPNNSMDLKLRCSAGSCECKNFSASAANKESLRICENCSHSWITHLLEKLLTPRDDALSIFDVCSLALYGTHALPIRLKIVIERLLATLQADEIDKILRSFGWTHQDLGRGYMIHDSRGLPLVRWSMLPREEEILILQQFLRFSVTRTLSFALLRDDFPLPPPPPPTSNNHSPKSPSQISQQQSQNHHQPQPSQNKSNHLSLPPPPIIPLNHHHHHHQHSNHIHQEQRTPPVKSPQRIGSIHQILNLSTQSSASEDETLELNNSAVDLSSKGLSQQQNQKPKGVNNNKIVKEFGTHESRQREVRPREEYGQIRKNQAAKRQWNPLPVTPTHLINPSTGKRRVQCSVCMKTFCDKGALKIHFSAVHLREMHKCTVAGCNMMFSSRRSRNRHSANPNPKLHAPHLRRKISPHDGRTCQPQTILNPLLLSPMRFPHYMPGSQPLGSDDKTHEETGSSRAEDEESLGYSYSPDDNEMDMEEDLHSHEGQEAESPTGTETEGIADKGRDGARKRKLANPVRLQSVADDSNDDFCCYDDGTEVVDDELDGDGDGGKRSEDEKSVKNGNSPKSENNNSSSPVPVQSNGNGEVKIKKEKRDIEHEIEGKKENGGSPGRSEKDYVGEKEDSSDEKVAGTGGSPKEIKKEGNSDDHLGRLESMPIFTSPHDSEDSLSSPKSDDEDNLDMDIPLDKENPRRCSVCGKVFQNHFGVKTHYQNVHLKLMHKCTVDGCNAAFPSKRSRDRHSSNLNLHRKLLSTSDISSNGSSSDLKERGTIFNPYFFHNGSTNQNTSPPLNTNPGHQPAPWNPFLPFSIFPNVFGAPPTKMESPAIVDCQFCGKSFEEGLTLNTHMELAHSQEGHSCHSCNSLFFSRRKLESHMKICSVDK